MARFSSFKTGTTENGSKSINIINSEIELPDNASVGENVFNLTNNRIYFWDGNNWQFKSLQNDPPVFSNVLSQKLQEDGTPLIFELQATDPEGFSLTYTFSSSNLNNQAIIGKVTDNSFSITPVVVTTTPLNFTVTFTASDGFNLVDIDVIFYTTGEWSSRVTADQFIFFDSSLPEYASTVDPWPTNYPFLFKVSSDKKWIIGQSSTVNDTRDESIGTWFYENVDGQWVIRQYVEANGVAYGTGEQLGQSVAIGETYAAVLKRNNSSSRLNTVRLFKLESGVWTDQFGFIVSGITDGNIDQSSMTDEYIILGAERQNSSQGRVFVYKIVNDTSVSLLTTLVNPNGGAGRFGSSVSISGNTFVVGAQLDGQGALYVYTINPANDSIALQATLLPGDGTPTGYNGFGRSAEIFGDYIVEAAASSQNTAGLFVYTRTGTTWSSPDYLYAAPPTAQTQTSASQFFGYPGIDIDDDGDVVVACRDEANNYVSVFTLSSNWEEVARLRAPKSDLAAFSVSQSAIEVYGNNIISFSTQTAYPGAYFWNKLGVDPDDDIVIDITIDVTNSGNNYILSGTGGGPGGEAFSNLSQPALTFNQGEIIQFNVNASTSTAHPFYIKDQQKTGTAYQVTNATGQGTTTLILDTRLLAKGVYGYQCSIHFGMWNTITIQ